MYNTCRKTTACAAQRLGIRNGCITLDVSEKPKYLRADKPLHPQCVDIEVAAMMMTGSCTAIKQLERLQL